MEAENGRLHFVSDIDNSQEKQKAEEIKKDFRDIGQSAEDAGRVGDAAFKNMADSAQASARKMSESIQASQNTVKDAVQGAVSESEKQMDRLKRAFLEGYNIDAPVKEIKETIGTQEKYLKELENQYKKTQSEIKKLSPGDEAHGKLKKVLAEQKQEIAEQRKNIEGMKQKYDELSNASMPSFRTQIMQITNQMARMRLEGKQNTEEYKKLETELGKLATIQREVRNNMTSDSTGATQWTGIIQGVQGLMGAYSVGSGIIGMFTKDQEKLMKVQTKMQSVMGILMGMQTIANTLHSTSTFRLRTLTKAQELYTLAVNKTKVALLSGSAAAKTFKIALASTGVGLLAVAIGALVSAISKMKQRAKEAAKETEALKKSLDIKYAGVGAVAKSTTEIDTYIAVLNKANLTKVEEKKLIDELNSKYGGLLGKYHTKAEWLEVLKTKTAEYINMLRLQAQAEEATKQAMEAADNEEAAKKKVEEKKKEKEEADTEYRNQSKNITGGWNPKADKALHKAIKAGKSLNDANDELDKAIQQRMDAFAKLEEINTKLQEQKLTLPGVENNTAEELRKQLEEIDKIRQNGLKSINANEIALMQEGKAKKLAEIEAERADMLAALDKEKKDLAKKLKEAGKGGLSEEDEANFTVRTTQINTIQDNKRAEVEKQSNEEIARMYRELGDVFATEEQKKLDAIKRRYEEQRKQLQKQKEGGSISEELYIDLSANVDKAEAKETFQYWLSEYGNYDQQRKALDDEWQARLKDVPPEFAAEAQKQMTEALSKLDFEQFKKTIDWSGIFGDLGNQSTQALQYNLQQVQAYFDNNKLNMGVDEIKDIQEAIKSMMDELEGRNPFAGLVNSIKDIGTAKAEAVAAIAEIKQANDELNAAKAEERIAEQEFLEYSAMVETADDPELMEAKIDAEERLAAAKAAVAAAEAKKATAEQKGVKASNSMATATKKFTSNLQNAKGAISGVASNAKDLAGVFSDEVAEGIGKAIDLFDTVIDSATNVIDTIANTGKKVGEAIEGTVEVTSGAMQATSTAAIAEMSAMEKASVILTIISAALQVATAIASLFGNGDEQKQKEIESLQKRIDQLQWELDNAAIIRVQGGEGADSVVDDIKKKYIDAAGEIGKAWQDTVGNYINGISFVWNENKFQKGLKKAIDAFNAEQVSIVAKGLVKDFANIEYAADKALGKKKWDQASENAQKYAEQMVLMQQQLEAEQGKKKKDDDKIKEYEQNIAELKQKINDEFNGVIEDILGNSYEDIAQTLGDAFFEAFESGADAAEAWGKAVDGIIADVIKKMMIQMFLEEQVANRINDFKKKVIKDGQVDDTAILDAANEMGEGLKEDYENFSKVIEALPDDIKAYFEGGAREASEKGIASISQDSADEMNGRLTAIQSHTYSINENTKMIVSISNSILMAVLEIQENTERIYLRLGGVETETKRTRESMETMQVRGIQLK